MKLRAVKTEAEWRMLETLYRSAFSCFAVTMNGNDLVLLDYFAICEEKRGKGLGGKSLRALQEVYRGKRFFLEVESLKVPADNMEERYRRKQFYLNNGMTELGVYAKLFGVEFELLGYECEVSFEDYFSLYDEIYGKYASKFLEEVS